MAVSTKMSDRERLIELLHGLYGEDSGRAEPETSGDPAEAEILAIVYQQLYQELRPRLLAEFGSQVGQASASTRFTELLNRFFAQVMEAFPEGMERLRNRRALSGYVAQAMRRMVYEHSRKRKRQAACDDTLLDCLVEDRRRAFHQQFPRLQYEAVLAVVQRWERSPEPRCRQWALLCNYRYVLMETVERTARDLGISVNAYYRLHAQALDQLRREVP